jgi:hypothetical protein
MRSIITTLLILCSMTFGLPGLSLAQAQPVSAQEKASLAALNQPVLLQQKAGGAPAAMPAISLAEQASLSSLGTQNAALLKQSAGERVVVVEREPGWRGGPRYGYGYGYGIGAIILVAVIVTLIVVGSGPAYRR